MLRLTAAHCPELTNLVRWLYELEPHLVTVGGDTVRSSTGTQQGCTLSNPLFALTMQYIARKLVINGLRVKQFYWDDTALVGTPEAVSKALEVICSLSVETGLNFRWKKCHLYGTPAVVERCKALTTPAFPDNIVIHDSYDMILYLKAPIGSDQFVAQWLKSKLSKLENIIKVISQMPFKHEGFTLLRSCAAECRVMYLMRVLPPRQMERFMLDFDKALQRGFEEILGIKVVEKWWRLAQLPPKFGGMSMRSGLRTLGAQHLCSLAKSADNVDRIVGGWDVVAAARRETEHWLNKACEESVDIEAWVTRLRSGEEDRLNGWFAGQNYRHSLAQLCELSEQKSVSKLMSTKERLHIEAHSGPSHAWVTLLPLSFKKYNLSSTDWIAAARRRLMLNVFPSQKHCTFCKGGWCDVKGGHATICGGGSSRFIRHNTMRNIIAKAARDVGFSTDLEHGGGLGDDRKPGDVILYNWRDGRHLLIDVAVVNPLCSSNVESLISEGVGGAAAAYGGIKKGKYHDLDFDKYEFLPFIMETTGGLSKAAHGFCKEIQKRHEASSCYSNFDGHNSYEANPLVSALNVELQRANSRMILERTPVLGDLIETAMVKCEMAVEKKMGDAIESLRLERVRPARIHEEGRRGLKCKNLEQVSKNVSVIQEKNDKSRKPLKKNKKKGNLSHEKRVRADGSRIQSKVVIIPPDPLPSNPKQPWEEMKESLDIIGSATMNWETEERILAPKSNTSQNSSTSLVPAESLLDISENIEKNQPEPRTLDPSSVNSHTGPTFVWASSSQVGKESKDNERVHWEPPSKLTKRQE